MELVNGHKRSLEGFYSTGSFDQLPIACREFLIQSYKGISYYLIDLKTTDWSRLSNIISACADVEKACWKPQENFFDYLAKCDILTYAVRKGRVVAFDVVTLLYSGPCVVYSNDETMVLKECRGMDIARKLVIVTLEWFFTRTACFKSMGLKYMVFTSVSANPRVVNMYFKNSWSRIFFDCSFKPSRKLIALKEEYCRKHRISLVNDDYPFCFKNLFPGSNNFDRNDPKLQFTSKVKASMPDDFEHMDRGDAFAFMLKIPLKAARFVVTLLMARCFGKAFLSKEGMGLFSSKNDDAPIYTEKWAKRLLIDPKPLHIAPKRDAAHHEPSSRPGRSD